MRQLRAEKEHIYDAHQRNAGVAEIKIILITIQTKKLGKLKFSTLSDANIAKTAKSIEKLPPDKEAFLRILDALQLEPKHDLGGAFKRVAGGGSSPADVVQGRVNP